MAEYVIRFVDGISEEACAVCGRQTLFEVGPHLCQADTLGGVCRSCAAKHAPLEAGLLRLAELAERIGSIARHNTYWIPLKAQLDLVHTAEAYAFSLSEHRGKLSTAN